MHFKHYLQSVAGDKLAHSTHCKMARAQSVLAVAMCVLMLSATVEGEILEVTRRLLEAGRAAARANWMTVDGPRSRTVS